MSQHNTSIAPWLEQFGFSFIMIPNDLAFLWKLQQGRVGITYSRTVLCQGVSPRGLQPKGELVGLFTLEESPAYDGIFDALGTRNYMLLERLSNVVTEELGVVFQVRRIEHPPPPVLLYVF